MIGIVNRIESATDVYVEFINGEKLHIHPELLLLSVERTNFEESDLVLVRHDLKKKITILKSYVPEWEDGMEEVGSMTYIFYAVSFGQTSLHSPVL